MKIEMMVTPVFDIGGYAIKAVATCGDDERQDLMPALLLLFNRLTAGHRGRVRQPVTVQSYHDFEIDKMRWRGAFMAITTDEPGEPMVINADAPYVEDKPS